MEEEAGRVKESEGKEDTKKTRPSKQHKESSCDLTETEAAHTEHAWV